MQITSAQLKLIEDLLPVQRGNVTLSNLHVFNAILYVAEHGCKWRGLPKKFGNWHSIYTRANRWAKSGVLDRVFAALQESDVINIQVDHVFELIMYSLISVNRAWHKLPNTVS